VPLLARLEHALVEAAGLARIASFAERGRADVVLVLAVLAGCSIRARSL
jgi:hypothetical protein